MGLNKGQTNNPNGRPKGSQNKTTTEMKEFIIDLLNKNRDKIHEDLVRIEPKDRLNVWLGLLPYVIPKHRSIAVDQTKVSRIIIEGLPTDIEDDLDASL